jgi:hypothetical protein
MRDIRSDLQERLEAVGRDKEEFKRRITELDSIEIAVKAVLKRENENFTAALPAHTERNLTAALPAHTERNLTERNFESFGTKDAVGSSFTARAAGNGFAAKDPVVNYAPKDAVGVVKPSHWGELKPGQ